MRLQEHRNPLQPSLPVTSVAFAIKAQNLDHFSTPDRTAIRAVLPNRGRAEFDANDDGTDVLGLAG